MKLEKILRLNYINQIYKLKYTAMIQFRKNKYTYTAHIFQMYANGDLSTRIMKKHGFNDELRTRKISMFTKEEKWLYRKFFGL